MSWKRILMAVLDQIPGADEMARAVVSRLRLHRRFAALNRRVRTALYPPNVPLTVQTGPFRGTLYFDQPVWGVLANKWLGSYEHELSDIIEQICVTPYDLAYDVGCAEGWYVVGLTRRMPHLKVVAFDTDPISRRQCRILARLNGSDKRVTVRGLCGFRDLQVLIGMRALLICDIEGAEVDLLDPGRAPALRSTDILVEIHESSAGAHAVADLLRSRFEESHRIESIAAKEPMAWVRDRAMDFAERLEKDVLIEAANEHRAPGNGWLWMRIR